VKNPDWDNFSFITLFVLKPGSDVNLTTQKINALVSKNVETPMQSYFIYTLNDLYLHGNFENGKSAGGNIEKIWLFMGLVLGILLIACINFMNLSTARSEKRAKEVAIKKTIGANRTSLVIQFLTESIILTLIAVVLAISLAELLLPTFNNLLNIKLSINYLNFNSWISVLAAALITGLIAGSYPAFYLSSFNPIQNLKRYTSNRFFDFNLRQILVVVQFSFSIILIVGTLVIYQQIQYAKNKPIGFDKDILIQMPQQGLLKERYNLLKDKLIKAGAVESMTQLSVGLSHDGAAFSDISWLGMTKKENSTPFNRIASSYDFIKTSGIKLAYGRDFSEKYASDSNAVLLSNSALKTMGFNNPIGKNIKIFGDTYHVIGVFDDFIWNTPYSSNDPMVVYFEKGSLGNITMRLSAKNDLQEQLDKVTRITKELNPTYPVEIDFLSNIYAEKFASEQRLGVLSNLFGCLAIFVSCMGLYGLVTYSAEQRTKEFGVRKVLGATVINLMQLLSFSFIKTITFAIIIAAPLSYYAMGKWLSKFEFHIEINWWIIPTAAFGTLMMALMTVSFQAYKLARANPVKALKCE
ncbi:MAG: ABC transporter permease, partial [Bacteroidia bacterium]